MERLDSSNLWIWKLQPQVEFAREGVEVHEVREIYGNMKGINVK